MRREISAARLREVLHYDPETGRFTWRVNASSRAKAGDIAGWCHGYVYIGFDGHRGLQAHQLAWLYMTGEWPRHEIDHVNGVKDDNGWSNLRPANRTQNRQNLRAAQRNNQTGYLGVVRRKHRFVARIAVDGVDHILGSYETPEATHRAYVEAKRQLHEYCSI